MKVKHARRARKVLTFFRAAHGFKPPFGVLVDGTAIQKALLLNLSLADALPKLLGGKVKLLVPKAAVAELHALGREFSAAAKYARRLKIVAADDKAAGNAAEALIGLVNGGNPNHHFVLTEDAELRHRLSELRAVPLVRFARDRLVLQAPDRLLATPVPSTEGLAAPSVGTKRLAPEAAAESQPKAVQQNEERPRKRQRLKEPNPLSVKKKKKKPEVNVHNPDMATGDVTNAEGANKRKGRGRRRRVGSQESADE